MKPLEIIILIGAISLVIFTIVINIIKKKKGKLPCGCDISNGKCSGCMFSNNCKNQNDTNTNN